MSHSKLGNKKTKPSHMRYISEGHRRANKIRRIKRFNPQQLDWWIATYG